MRTLPSREWFGAGHCLGIIEDHGSELKLSNRERGGLKVNIVLSLI
ncbi:hypothetical protein DSM14862_03313 (plasmid) [Sulfitobacter indolifex]|nr:hypothetical protein DSM14862_03313 [Sulfitobacter indolifex]